MRSKSTLVVLFIILSCGQTCLLADIFVGPWQFGDDAFGDEAIKLESGPITLYHASDLQSALTGYSPTTAIANIGFNGRANLFEIKFTDLLAINEAGDDLVFFEFAGPDSYEIALHTSSGYTPYIAYNYNRFISVGNIGPQGYELFGMAIDFDDYGFSQGVIVDSFCFRAMPGQTGTTQGDPVMFGALNAVPEPTTFLLLGFGAVMLRKRRRI